MVRHGPAENKKYTDAIDKVSRAYRAGRTVPIAATRIYELAFFTGFAISSIMYYVLNKLWPVVGASSSSSSSFEEMGVDERLRRCLKGTVATICKGFPFLYMFSGIPDV